VEFVPALLRADDGRTWVEYGSRLWELSTWMPGRADFHKAPSASRLESSCRALGRLHRAWAAEETKAGPCPGIQRRIERSCEWKELVASGWIPVFGAPGLDSVRGYAERAWLLVRVFAERVPSVLAEWASRPFRLQPCLCDIWHDHVLFDGENVRGLIDYGGVKIDNVTVDLARLLGSMVGDHRAARDAGLRAYSLIRTLADEEQAIVDLLDKTGTIVGLENWLRWLYFDKKPLIDLGAVSERLRNLVERVEEWETAGSGAL